MRQPSLGREWNRAPNDTAPDRCFNRKVWVISQEERTRKKFQENFSYKTFAGILWKPVCLENLHWRVGLWSFVAEFEMDEKKKEISSAHTKSFRVRNPLHSWSNLTRSSFSISAIRSSRSHPVQLPFFLFFVALFSLVVVNFFIKSWLKCLTCA